jgi:hypothetical protein
MAASAFGLAILGILVIIIARLAKVEMTGDIWLMIQVLPGVGLILGTLFGIAFIIAMTVRRSRLARDAAE